MSFFSRSRLMGVNGNASSTTLSSRNEQNITHRKKLSTVSTSINGDDGMVAASPRNSYHRNAAVLNRRRDEADGAGMSSTGRSESTPVERRAAEIRLKNVQGGSHPPPSIEASSSTTIPETQQNISKEKNGTKKSRASSASLASVIRTRAGSPIEKMRKFIGRTTSKSTIPKPENNPEVSALNEEIHKLRRELMNVRSELDMTRSELRLREADIHQIRQIQKLQKEKVKTRDVETETETMTSSLSPKPVEVKIEVEERAESSRSVDSATDKENVNPRHQLNSPEIVCLDDEIEEKSSSKIWKLEQELVALKLECEDQKEDFRRTRKDFILILKEAVLRKNEAEVMLESISKSITDDEDWSILMSQHRHTLRRNVLLMWAQKKLEPYADQLEVSNFSSDWTDCRAFCGLIYDMFPHLIPDVEVSPIVGDCISRCRFAFDQLEIPFEYRALGISQSQNVDDDTSSACSTASTTSECLPDWRYIMETVFLLYKRGVLGQKKDVKMMNNN